MVSILWPNFENIIGVLKTKMTIPEFPELKPFAEKCQRGSTIPEDFFGYVYIYNEDEFLYEVCVNYEPTDQNVAGINLLLTRSCSTHEEAITQAREAWQTAWHAVFNLVGLETMDQMNGVDWLIDRDNE